MVKKKNQKSFGVGKSLKPRPYGLNIRVDSSLRDRLVESAKLHDLSLSGEVRRILNMYYRGQDFGKTGND